MNKKNGYYTNQHSCFLLQYHLVLVTKYRHPVIGGNLKDDLISHTKNYFSERGLVVVEINSDKDHIHILFDAYPNFNVMNFINAFKSSSSRNIRKKYADYLKKYYWKPYFWSSSYFIGSVSDKTEDVVKNYIKTQGNK